MLLKVFDFLSLFVVFVATIIGIYTTIVPNPLNYILALVIAVLVTIYTRWRDLHLFFFLNTLMVIPLLLFSLQLFFPEQGINIIFVIVMCIGVLGFIFNKQVNNKLTQIFKL